MNDRPRIGIVAHTDLNHLQMPATIIPLAYSDAVARAGGVPLVLPFVDDCDRLPEMLAVVDGVLIPGGKDVDPAAYHQPVHPHTAPIDPALDRFQLAVTDIALARKLPLLGICRGAQLVNVALGGTLYQDLAAQFSLSQPSHMQDTLHFGTDHMVTTEAGSRLHALFGPTLAVNSRHHQAIDTTGQGLVITAKAPDGVIEAVQHRTLPIDLVQWHPELMLQRNDAMLPLFKELIERCRQK